MTRKPDDTEPTGAPDAAIDSLLDDAGAIDIRAEQASSDGLEQARYYAQARAAQPRAHTKTDPLSNVIVEKTPRPGPDAITEIPVRAEERARVAPPSTPRELVATEISVQRVGLEPSTARKIAAVFVGAALVALGVAAIAFVLRARQDTPTDRMTTTSASVVATTPPPASTPSAANPPASAPSATTTEAPRPPTTARPTSSAREPQPPTSAASATAPSPTHATSSAPPPTPSASVRFGGLVQEDVK